MRSRSALAAAALLLLPPALGGCAFGAYISPLTPLERAVNGTYEGIGVGGTGRVPYRLTLTVQEREGRATGAITNLESRKAYAASGTFKRTAQGQTSQGGALELSLFENGDKHRGNIHATVTATKISGVLRTVLLGRELLGYTIELNQVGAAAAVVTPTAAPTPATP